MIHSLLCVRVVIKKSMLLETLPCGGCAYCTRCHHQWARFEADVDDVIPMALRQVGTDLIDPLDDKERQTELTEVISQTPEELRKLQLEDPELSPIVTWLETTEPTEAELFRASPGTKHLWNCRSQLKLLSGVLYYRWDFGNHSRLKLVVPSALRDQVISMYHDTRTGGHFGREKTLERVKYSFFWHQMAKGVKVYAESCSVCRVNKKINRTPRTGLGDYQAGAPLERVHLDLLGPFRESAQGNKYILMAVDQFTKWVSCIPLPNQTAVSVAGKFFEHFIALLGCPLQIHTDQGRNFDGRYFQALCDLLEIVKTRTTPYRPSSNGQVERYNRSVLQFVRCFLEGKQGQWDRYLPSLGMSLRSMVSKSTGFTPNYLMFGHEINLPAEILMGLPTVNLQQLDPSEHAKELEQLLKESFQQVRQNLQGVQLRQKRLYDRKRFHRVFEKGDIVYRLDSASKVGESKKLQPIFLGPFLIVKQVSPDLFYLEDRKRSRLAHHDTLQPCKDRNIPFWLRRKRHLLMETVDLSLGETEPREEEEGNTEGVEGDNLPPLEVVELPTESMEDSLGIEEEDEGEEAVVEGTPVGVTVGDTSPLSPLVSMQETEYLTRRGRAVQLPSHLRNYVMN